jgi:muramoyltetrapeptide carboxypeptidase
MSLVRPPRLVPGDVIGVAATGGPSDPAALDRGLARLEACGYRLRLATNVRSRGGLLGLAGSDAERLAGYLQLLRDPEVKAIVFARGGYGTGRLTPHLDPEELRANPKIHCGFSDLTVLAGFLLTRCGIPSFHGPMVAADLSRDPDPLADRFFPSMLEGRGPSTLELTEADVLLPGHAQGPLVGGCLSILAAMVGSPEELDYEGALVFLEDVAEEAFRIDRMLGTLIRAGRFDRISGILIGSLSGITFGGGENPGRLRELLVERLSPLGVPVAAGLPAGHRGTNVALPIGARSSWDPEARVLRFHEEIVT